jgi:hypothetical protein
LDSEGEEKPLKAIRPACWKGFEEERRRGIRVVRD